MKDKKIQKAPKLKEVKFGINIGEHDFQIKLKNIRQFLEKGYTVRITVVFKGREITRQKDGIEIIERIKKEVANLGKTGQDTGLKGRTMSVTLSAFKKN